MFKTVPFCVKTKVEIILLKSLLIIGQICEKVVHKFSCGQFSILVLVDLMELLLDLGQGVVQVQDVDGHALELCQGQLPVIMGRYSFLAKYKKKSFCRLNDKSDECLWIG